MINKRLINTGEAAPAPLDPLQNFETVTYTGNGSTQKITGYIRKGGAFNGSSSQVTFPYLSGITPTSNISASLWINGNAQGNADNVILSLWDNSNLELRVDNISPSVNRIMIVYRTTDYGSIDSTFTMDVGVWTHLAFTYSYGVGFTVYKNGVSSGLLPFTGTIGTLAGTNKIGAFGINNSQYFNGKIDQVRVFNKALSSGEVTTLYGETYASSTKSTTDIFGDSSGVALYELDEDANDTGVPIDSGQSAVFNGSSSYIDLGSTIDNPLRAAGEFGVSLWFNINSYTLYSTIFKLLNDIYIYIFVNTSNQLECRVGNSSDVQSTLTFGVSLNTWYHVVWTGNSTNGVTLYINGSAIGNSPWDGTFLTYTDPSYKFNLLGYNGGGVGYYDGKIDQVRIYSSALSSGDVTNLYNETSVPTANLVAHYKLDGDATDEQGSYNGTATNITYSDEVAGIYYNGTPTNVNFLGMAFQPDLVWVKSREVGTNAHVLQDSVRGAGQSKTLHSNFTIDEGTYGNYGYISSFDSNGFGVAAGTTSAEHTNFAGENYVAWCWKAGGSVTPNNNTNGTIASTVSANQDAGFSIVTYTGNGNNSATVGHGLSSAPEMIIVKDRSAPNHWVVVHTSCTITGTTTIVDPEYKMLRLDGVDAEYDYQNLVVSPGQSSTTFTLGNQVNINAINNTYVAYCFHSVDGYQKVGSYNGGSSGSSNVITTGFKPRFLLVKRTDISGDAWQMFDSIRGGGDTFDNYVQANNSDAEVSYNQREVNFTNNGFYWTFAESGTNISGGTYIYLAIA